MKDPALQAAAQSMRRHRRVVRWLLLTALVSNGIGLAALITSHMGCK